MDTEEKFWNRVDIPHGGFGCWEWDGPVDRYGYGHFCTGHSAYILSHRFAWKIAHGSLPKNLCVCHHCDNRKCVNPSHLFLGTNADNMRDRNEKGNTTKGEKNGSAKLTKKDVQTIRLLSNFGTSQTSIANTYDISRTQVGRIISGERWASV